MLARKVSKVFKASAAISGLKEILAAKDRRATLGRKGLPDRPDRRGLPDRKEISGRKGQEVFLGLRVLPDRLALWDRKV